MKNFLKYMMVIGLSLLTYSCYYDQLPDEDTLPLPTDVSFQGQVQPILNQNCVSCHSGQLPPDLRSANSFNSLFIEEGLVVPFDADNSELLKHLSGNGAALMPPSGSIRQSDINIIRQWIIEGALNN